MPVSAEVFISRLPKSLVLDADIHEYLVMIVDGQEFVSTDSLREETQHFLIDAGLEDETLLEEFYKSMEDQVGQEQQVMLTERELRKLRLLENPTKPVEPPKVIPTITPASTRDAINHSYHVLQTSSSPEKKQTVAATKAKPVDTKPKPQATTVASVPTKAATATATTTPTTSAPTTKAKTVSSSSDDDATSNPTSTKKPKEKKPSKLAQKLAAKRGEPIGDSPSESSIVTFEGSNFDNPVIEAYSQQSRFHGETLETLSKTVDLKDVNITIADKPLLTDTRLWLKAGTMYGLVGRNGTGKSTLLKAIGYGQLIGYPLNLRTLYIEQLPAETPEGQTVVETVLKADTERTLLMSESKHLQEALHGNPRFLPKAIKRLQWERKLVELQAAQKVAIKRSGKRGADARDELLVAEAAERKAQEDYEAVPVQGIDPSLEEINDAHALLEQVAVRLQQIEADSAEAHVRELLRGLGFTAANQDLPIKQFSGGWRMRIALAQALFLKPDVLLLDEPTNHLDLPAIIWLQNYLLARIQENQVIVVVSHDRQFLNNVTEEVIRLRNHKLTYHPGNYDEYEMKMEDLAKKKDRIVEALENKRKRAQETINKARAIMNKTGDDKRGGMIASRKKKLDRLQGHNKLENGKRFKQSYHAGYHNNQGIIVEREETEPPVTIPLPVPKELRSNTSSLLSLNNVTFSYPKSTLPASKTNSLDKVSAGPVIQNVSLSLFPSSRVALLGPNGCGKSTIMSLLAGDLLPTTGTVERASSLVKVGYFSQHNVNALDSLSSKSAMIHLMETFPEDYKTQPQARKYLGSFGISGPRAVLPMSTLSGGEKARVALALCVNGGPQVLLLDEITNHLDMATIEGLVVALKEFDGAVVMVSHDAYFVKAVCEKNPDEENGFEDSDEEDALARQEEEGVVYRVKGGKLIRLDGGVDEYVKTVIAEGKKKGMRAGVGRPI